RVRGVAEETARDRRSHCVQAILERRGDPEVAAATANAPEQLGVLVLTHAQNAAVGSDEFHRGEIVEGESILAHQPSDTATEGETRNSRGRHDPSGGSEPMQLRLAVELAPGDAA